MLQPGSLAAYGAAHTWTTTSGKWACALCRRLQLQVHSHATPYEQQVELVHDLQLAESSSTDSSCRADRWRAHSSDSQALEPGHFIGLLTF